MLGRRAAFEATLIHRLDQNHRAHFLWTASNRWFAARLDLLTASVTLAVGLAVVLFRDHLSPSLAALALTYVVQTTSLFQWGFRMWAEVRHGMRHRMRHGCTMECTMQCRMQCPVQCPMQCTM